MGEDESGVGLLIATHRKCNQYKSTEVFAANFAVNSFKERSMRSSTCSYATP
jgi:hypothetical protein